MASKPKSRLSVFRHRRTSDASLQARTSPPNNNNGINEKTNYYGGNPVPCGRRHSSVNSDNKTDDSDDSNKFTDDEDGRQSGKQAGHHQINQRFNGDGGGGGSNETNGGDEGEEEDFELDPLPERDERFWYSANDISLSQLSHNVTTNALSSSGRQQAHHEEGQDENCHSAHHHHRASSSSSSLSSTEAITREKRLAKALLHLHIQAAENVVASSNAKQTKATKKNGQLLSRKKGGNKESGHDDSSTNKMTKSRRKKSRNAIASLVDSHTTTVNPSLLSSQVHMNPNGQHERDGNEDDEEDDKWENESLSHHQLQQWHQQEYGPPNHLHFDEESTIEIKLSTASSHHHHHKSDDQSNSKSHQPSLQQSKAVGMRNKRSKPILLHYHHNKLEDTDEITSTPEPTTKKTEEKAKKKGRRSLSLPEKIWNELLGRSHKKQKRLSSFQPTTEQVPDLQNDYNLPVNLRPPLSKFQNNTYRLSAPTFPLPSMAFSERSMDSLVTMSSIVIPGEPEIKRERNRWALFSFRRKAKRAPSLPSPRDHLVLANSVREKPEKSRKSIVRRKHSLRESRRLSNGIEIDSTITSLGNNNNNERPSLSNLQHMSSTNIADRSVGNGRNDDEPSGFRPDCEIVSMDLDQGPGLSKKSSGFFKSFRLKKNKVSSAESDKVTSPSASVAVGSGSSSGCCTHGSAVENDKKGPCEINVNVWNKKGIGGTDGNGGGSDGNNKNKFISTAATTTKKKKSTKKTKKSTKGTEDEEGKTSANIFQAFYYAGRRHHESVTAKDFDDVTLDLASGELKKTRDGTVIVENATEADVDIVPSVLPSGSGADMEASACSRSVREIAHDVPNIHNDHPNGQNLRVREILGNHRGGFRPSLPTTTRVTSSSSSSSAVTNCLPSNPVTVMSMTKKQDLGSNSIAALYATPHKNTKNKNQSDDDISSIIPTSSTLVTQQLLTFDSTQECSSQTDAQILAHHQQQKDEGRTGDEVEEEEEDGDSVSISPAKSLLGRVRDFHRNGVFGFAGSSSGGSPNSHKSSPGDANNPNANHMLGRNGSSSSSNDFYGSSNVATCNLSGQSYRGDSEEKNDVRRGKECGKNDTRNGGSSRSRKMTRAQGLRNDEALNGISGGSESLRNSSEEELTSINNVSVGRLPIPSAAATTVTTTVTMALPPARRSNLLNSSGAGSLSDSGSTTSTTGGGSSSMEDYNGPFVGKAVALVDCTPSPYDRHALRYKKGDVLQIICKKPTGSWTGKVNNQVGHFKFINVQVLPDDEEEEEEDVFDMDYEGDYSRDEDYYYNNCTRGGPASSGGYDSDSHSSIRRRNNRHHRKPSVMTPWELEQRQTVASVINGIRKENKALRHHHEAAAEGTFPDSPPTNEGSSSEPPYWNDLDGRGGGSKSSDSSLTKLTGIPAVKRTNSRRGERSKSSKQKKEKKGRPKSVGDLLQRIHLQEYISVFILHGFDSLDLFKELEEEDLDRLAIPNGADRAKILTAVELLREYDTEEEIPIPMIIPPAPPSLPPPSSSSATSSRGPSESRAFPRDSGIFVKCDEDCEGDAENLELSATSLSLKENPTSAQEHNPDFKSNGDLSVFIEAGGNANFSISRKNLDQMEDNDGSRRETNQVNDTALAATSSANEELILSPLNLHKIQVGGPSFPHNRSSSPEGQQADLFGDVKQRFLNAKSMFELATTNESPNPGAAATAKNNRFSLDKSADSGLSCPTNSPPLMRTDN